MDLMSSAQGSLRVFDSSDSGVLCGTSPGNSDVVAFTKGSMFYRITSPAEHGLAAAERSVVVGIVRVEDCLGTCESVRRW